MRSVVQPCSADADVGIDGVVDGRTVYIYDPQGRSLRDTVTDAGGALVAQSDYSWDNAGHAIRLLHNDLTSGYRSDNRLTFDTLGRRVEFRYEDYQNDVLLSRQVITYSDFDELGHAAHGAEAIDIFTDGTSKTRTRSYGYDDLGRRISLEVRQDETVRQSWHHVYDEEALTVTTTLLQAQIGEIAGAQIVYVDSYDADYHPITTHEIYTGIGDNFTYTRDTRNEWSGDRQLSSKTTSTVATWAPVLFTFHYDCPAARAGLGGR